ncbi:Hpt protein [Alkalidesulfovibrio alkalitolerans DSM 16529]|jgi:HPt (histidine-containing phosphotransfer) domain-containing protein|uniref:Hpt protein n=1 Tax=Alkalidesulfovibrio alkalitolerans DSM 16529 TaxID=1121439 RepID=S7UF00_9BACT|nr:Hpt domain-containing protein [Alkalidesulfovibrio alkalitolerans]EPR32394.1 Hpt protein [Alkalidesulfovibrio alkalitolerans DSM 16529]
MNLDDLPVVEQTRSLARVGGDMELLQELYGVFASVAPERIMELREALAAGETNAIWRAAHSLKGECGAVGAERCREAAARLEDAARVGDLVSARSLLPLVERGLAEVLGSLALGRVDI